MLQEIYITHTISPQLKEGEVNSEANYLYSNTLRWFVHLYPLKLRAGIHTKTTWIYSINYKYSQFINAVNFLGKYNFQITQFLKFIYLIALLSFYSRLLL